MRSVFKVLFLALCIGVLSAGASRAGDAEVNLLRTYIGNWSGQSVLTGGDYPEEFGCRLKVTQGKITKINYSGRCSLVNMNLSVSGTIEFSDKNDRYEATMRSNVGFKAAAVGRKKGDTITFTLNEKQSDSRGTDFAIASVLTLSGNQITVDFTVELNRSGQLLKTKVPFTRN